jgi:hypothetical protein
MWGALSDEMTGLSFTVPAGTRQRSYSRVRVPWDWRPYLNVSDSRLPISSPPTTRRVTVEVFDWVFTRDSCFRVESHVTTDGQSATLSWNTAPIWGLGPDSYYYQTVARLSMWGALSDEGTDLSFTVSAGTRQRSHSRV